jgi:hypothetical protein
MLLDGGAIHMMADAGSGREVFRVALLRSGWLSLSRQTGARVLPVLTHLAGRVQVIAIHPALPTGGPGAAGELPVWRDILVSLVQDHVRRFPEQCPALVEFPAVIGRGSRHGAMPREEVS